MGDAVFSVRDRDLLTLAALALLGTGLLLVQSAAMDLGNASAGFWEWSPRGVRHAIYCGIAVVGFLVATRISPRLLDGDRFGNTPAAWALAAAAMLCLAVLIPGVGVEVNGARRWLGLGPVRVQPSEFAKWGVVLFLAWRLSRPGPFTLQSFLTTCGVVGGVCLLVVIEDFGTAALIGLTAGFLMLVGPVRLRWLLAATIPAGAAAFGVVYSEPALGPLTQMVFNRLSAFGLFPLAALMIAAPAAFGFVYSEPYRWRRIVAFLDPWAAPETDGYHVIQSLYSFAGGGWTGRGLGNGVQKLGYLPEDATDFIFAVVCEELGIFGAGLVVLAYLTLLAAGLGVAAKATHGFGRLLAFGVVATLGLQAATNIAVATASVPTKGIPLPLVSAGGTGLVCTAVMLGLVVAVARQQDTTPVVVEPDEDESED